jgi:hypothetical protein
LLTAKFPLASIAAHDLFFLSGWKPGPPNDNKIHFFIDGGIAIGLSLLWLRVGSIPMKPDLNKGLHRLQHWFILYKKGRKKDRTHGTDVTFVGRGGNFDKESGSQGGAIIGFSLRKSILIRYQFFIENV